MVNRGAAIYGDKIYFGTLDARMVALNLKTGDVVWNRKIDDYKAGYSYTAAPMIVDGKVIVDPKVVTAFNETHLAQMLGYLNITGLDVALLLNFREATLAWKRVLRAGTAED